MKFNLRNGAALFLLLTLAACNATPEVADVIYSGGPIVTMVDEGDRVEALAVKDGRILVTGSTDDVMAHAGTDTRLVDLAGRALMPGFIDPHSHVVMQAGKFACVNLDPYPIGDIRTIADIQRKLRERIEEKDAGAVIVGWGYDDTSLEEQRHPDRNDLDAVSEDQAIVLIHISSHLATGNSKALELAGISAETPDPEGGRIQRMPGSREPSGVMEELAMNGLLSILPTPTAERAQALIEEGLKLYAAEGITTAQDGATFPGAVALLRSLAESGRMPIDVVSYPLYKACDDELVDEIARSWKEHGRFRLGGVKLVADGSIQGYTAYLTEPYYKRPGEAAVESAECESPAGMAIVFGEAAGAVAETGAHADAATDRGYPGMAQEDIDAWLRRADEAGFPLLVHCNGDAATDMLIEATRKVRGDQPRPDLRTTIIHAQVLRDDQLDFAAAQGLVPSFFPIHVVFWGDRHRDLFLGPERAARIDPARSALDRGMKITLHHDAPIAHWGMLPVVSAAVNRVTSGGEVLGPDERISAYEAFRAVTADAAWQYFEEDRKGTLEAGKLADMVILDQDPLAIDPAKILDLQVLETIKEGVTVYRAGS